MDGHRIGKLQLLKPGIRIFHHTLFIKLYRNAFRLFIDLPDDPHISIKNSKSFFHWNPVTAADFPLQLIVILHLHDLITFAKKYAVLLLLCLCAIRRIEILLQNFIEPLYTKQPFAHRC